VLTHCLRRLLIALPTAVGVATLVFLLIHATPGDPVDAMLGESASPASRSELRAHLGLDRPLSRQYLSFLAGLARGDLGTSIHSGESVTHLIAEHFPMTVLLTGVALVLALTIAVPLGLLAAAHKGRAADRFCLAVSLLGVSLPNFWLGPILVLVFSITLGVLPVAGSGSPLYVVLPAVTLIGIVVTSHLSLERDVRLAPGATAQLGATSFTLVSVERVRGPNYLADRATVRIDGDGASYLMFPEKRRYLAGGNVMTEAAIDAGVTRDVYVAMGEPLEDGAWTLRLHHKPLVRWVWVGALIMAFGGALAITDARYRRLRVRRDVAAPAGSVESGA